MSKEQLDCLPFRYPTTVFLIDDSADFLYNFSFQLDEDQPVRTFTSPHKALEVLLEERVDPRLERRNFVLEHKQHYGHPTLEHVIGLDLSAIYLQMYRQKRFAEPSVVIVDYQMEEMNGLDVCRRLVDTPIKRILLTGQADATTAVTAFNDGLIDRFVYKNLPNTLELINSYIRELEYQYFRDASSILIRALSAETPSLLQDAGFIEFFRGYRRQHQICEHYLVANPSGFLMLDRHARARLMLVMTEEELDIQRRVASDEGAPMELLDALRDGDRLPFFHAGDGFYRQGLVDWEAALHPARRLRGETNNYLYAVLDDTTPYNTAAGTVPSLVDYLDHDANGR
ncbi:MAG: response regulator [Chromatiales bacterium]|nr:response regulator [Gammaproteobacteria bacterium]MCP5230965.1 response regulator [Zoogloeaceae bacterium]MCP5351574.1 response regulator [Chromatiales bacterium]